MELPSLIDKCVNIVDIAIRAFAQCRSQFMEQQRLALSKIDNVNVSVAKSTAV